MPLACGGPDSASNLQWQTVAAAKAKDRWERKVALVSPTMTHIRSFRALRSDYLKYLSELVNNSLVSSESQIMRIVEILFYNNDPIERRPILELS